MTRPARGPVAHVGEHSRSSLVADANVAVGRVDNSVEQRAGSEPGAYRTSTSYSSSI